MTTGVDLVKLQLLIADGGRLDDSPPPPTGHAVAVYAAGRRRRTTLPPHGRRNRVAAPTGWPRRTRRPERRRGRRRHLTGAARHRHSDRLGSRPDEAVVRLARALAETVVVVEGGATNRGAADRPVARRSRRAQACRAVRAAATRSARLVVAAIDGYDSELMGAHASFFAWGRRGRPQATNDISRRIELQHHGGRYVLDVSRTGPTTLPRSAWRHPRRRRSPPHEPVRESDDQSTDVSFRVVSSTTGTHHDVEIDGAAHHFVRDDGSLVRAPMPGVVVSVSRGARRPARCRRRGGRCRDHEARDDCHRHHRRSSAPGARRSTNVHVPAGAILVRLVPDADAPTTPSTELQPVSRRSRPPKDTLAERCDANLLTLSNLLLGYDVHPADVLVPPSTIKPTSASLWRPTRTFLRREIALVTLFADLRVLFRSRHDEHETRSARYAARRSTSSPTFARSTPSAKVCPTGSWPTSGGRCRALRRAIARARPERCRTRCSGSSSRNSGSTRKFRSSSPCSSVGCTLQRPTTRRRHALRACLGHLIAATVHRHPVIADLAREVRFHRFDEPVLANAQRAAVCGDGAAPRSARRCRRPRTRGADHIDALVELPAAVRPGPARTDVGSGRRRAGGGAGGHDSPLLPHAGTRRPRGSRRQRAPDAARYLRRRGTAARVHVLTTTGSIDELDADARRRGGRRRKELGRPTRQSCRPLRVVHRTTRRPPTSSPKPVASSSTHRRSAERASGRRRRCRESAQSG